MREWQKHHTNSNLIATTVQMVVVVLEADSYAAGMSVAVAA